MIVSMWMTRNLITVPPHASVAEAAALMARQHVRRLLVVEGEGSNQRLLGMVSASDILHAFPPDVNPFAVEAPDARQTPTTTAEIMTREITTTQTHTPIEEAAALMRDQKIGALPVLHEGRLVGLITESDIFGALVSLFAVSGPGARITFDMSRDEDVFSWIGPIARKRHMRIVSLIATGNATRPECVVRIAGDHVEKFLEDIWASGHLVLNVLRFPLPPGK